ncbi:hypothetical protein [Haloarchaeobius sp. HRN-SO-5]|uniref:hypothetical protein n=1 Tax=Haloarchaeobius sp. HRN-SO-5 TaxID=3446118 RepID=UPI003EBF8A5F
MTVPEGELPEEIESRIEEPNFDKDLTQRQVALEFYHGNRPYYNITKMRAALGTSKSRDTVGNRLSELYDRDVLEKEEINNGDIYWLSNEDTRWPSPPDADLSATDDGISVSEWRKLIHVRVSAIAIGWAILGTAITLVGVFQTGGHYQLPLTATELISIGLGLGIFSYLGLFLAGVAWVFDIEEIEQLDPF